MSVTREQISNSKLEQLLPPIVINANKNDIAAAEVSGFESANLMISVGTSAVELDDTHYMQVKLQHSNDKDINFQDCSNESVISNTGFGNNISVKEQNTGIMVSYIGSKSYVKPVITKIGNLGNGVTIGISALLHNPKYKPVE
ncbi:hypothetical protein RHORCCE3_0429 [Rickettsia hoogstraalii str. RCCE3]|nr:hypothetical protein RHORCCE3_0429 [Rickettsia hoogstraalii str. RCCE3]